MSFGGNAPDFLVSKARRAVLPLKNLSNIFSGSLEIKAALGLSLPVGQKGDPCLWSFPLLLDLGTVKGTVSPPILTLARCRQPVASRPVFFHQKASHHLWGECSRRTIRSPVEIPGDSPLAQFLSLTLDFFGRPLLANKQLDLFGQSTRLKQNRLDFSFGASPLK